MWSRTKVMVIPLLAAALGVMSTSSALAQQISATATTISVVENGAFADVRLRITVTNDEASSVSDAWVVFADGIQVGVGDVPAGGSAESGEEARTIDLAVNASRNVAMPVTLRFTTSGGTVELAQTLVVHLGAPGGGR